MNSYERMAQIIKFLDDHYREQPSLNDLARLAGLSPSHFHREFQRWTGVSPKDFVEHLTHQYARRQLSLGASVLETSLAAGLSRLHDLCLTLEAVTPGTVRGQGEGLEFRVGTAPSPFGLCAFAETQRGLSRFEFVSVSEDTFHTRLKSLWPNASFRSDPSRAKFWVDQVFKKKQRTVNDPLRL